MLLQMKHKMEWMLLREKQKGTLVYFLKGKKEDGNW